MLISGANGRELLLIDYSEDWEARLRFYDFP